jgi:hypothetical protein
MTESSPWLVRPDGVTSECIAWRPTTLRELHKDERFLEEILAANPAMLGLENRRTQISGPYKPFRQLALNTPQSRSVKPDIVFLTASGHVIVIEVKLGDNPELGDRRVVAQLLDYASSLAAYDEDDLAELFGARESESFAELVGRTFPGVAQPGELADVLLERIRNAEIHLVIACDGAPEGLRESVRGISRQAALGTFDLRVLELTPHETTVPGQGFLLVPASPVKTEIVSRTSVTISIEEGQAKPGVSVVVSSPDEVEEAVRKARGAAEMRPLLGAVVQAYDAAADPLLRTRGTAANYRQVKIPGWPGPLHYEFQSYGRGEVGVELHLESDAVRPLQTAFAALAEALRASFPAVAWEPAWSDGRGRIMMRLPASDPAIVANAMRDFIARTRPTVEEALGRLAGAAP